MEIREPSAADLDPLLTFFERVPDYLLPTEWASFKSLQLSDETAIPNKYKEMIGLAVSGATRCRYCVYFHTEAAKLFGATEEEITETAELLESCRLGECHSPFWLVARN